MSTPSIDVHAIAQLIRIRLTESEAEILQSQLDKTLLNTEKIKHVNTDGIEPTLHAVDLFNIVRKDIVKPSFGQKKALSIAPQQANGLLIVPKVLE